MRKLRVFIRPRQRDLLRFRQVFLANNSRRVEWGPPAFGPQPSRVREKKLLHSLKEHHLKNRKSLSNRREDLWKR
jgi:hypothetical protein